MGSNLGARIENLKAGLDGLRGVIALRRVSSVYETDPVGETEQPAFLNLAVAGSTNRSPRGLLAAIKEIELDVGRRPTYRWGPRVLDIDMLLYGCEVIEEEDLQIPHPRLAQRAFVLVPLAEIDGEVMHPVLGKSIQALRDELPGVEGVRNAGVMLSDPS